MVLQLRWLNAVGRDEGCMFIQRKRQAGRGELFTSLLLFGAGMVEGEEMSEDVCVLAHAVGGF